MNKISTVFLTVMLLIFGMSVTAFADWDPQDGHKMHFPQFPDSTFEGWDVNATWPCVLADDWVCSETGFVKDIHFWGSWRQDVPSSIDSFLISIHSNDPGPPSKPVNPPLWEETIRNFVVRNRTPFEMEGWFDPCTGVSNRQDHWNYYQYNIFLPESLWFFQQAGTVYWLNISAFVSNPLETQWGWKNSKDHFMDDAVVGMEPDYDWVELFDPITGESLDLSFVITGDPYGTADTCLTCSIDICDNCVPCDGSYPIQFHLSVTNCGSVAVPVYAEIYPTIGDCAGGTQYDYNINKLLTASLAPASVFDGYYYYYAGNVCALNLGLVAISVDVGPAINNWFSNCCDEFYFTSPFGILSGPSLDPWGTEGSMFYEESDIENLPIATSLNQNYPNPFNANTNISFDLAQTGNVNLSIYNLAGQKVETLINNNLDAGQHNVSWDASTYSSGIYYYKLTAGNKSFTKRMTLLK